MHMTDEIPDKPPISRPSVRLAFAILAWGLVGVASLYLMPLETLLPEGIELPRIVLLINPAIFVAIAAFVGWFAAPRAGLHAPVIEAMLQRRSWQEAARGALLPALIVGAIGGAVLLAYGAATSDLFTQQGADMPQPLATRMLYGGVSEEIMLRWGMMSLLAWLLLRVRAPRGTALWAANVGAALLFGLGHFPALFAVLPDPPMHLVALVLLANAGLGILFGWLFMRRGLECAMLAHALTHLFGVGMSAMIPGLG